MDSDGKGKERDEGMGGSDGWDMEREGSGGYETEGKKGQGGIRNKWKLNKVEFDAFPWITFFPVCLLP